nr:mucin-17-like [Aedes albopictus]
MADIARLLVQLGHVEDEVRKVKKNICVDGVLQPSLARRMLYEGELQCHYKEYRRVCFELLSTLPPERHDELDKDASHFEEIYRDAWVLVEKLFYSFPSTGDMHQNDRTSSNCFTATTAPRWRTPPIRSRTTTPTTEHPVPIPAVNETPRTSFPSKIKVSTIFADPIQNKKPPHDEDTVKNTSPPTSKRDSRVGNEPTEFVNSKTEDSKTMTIPMPTGLGPVLMPFRPPPGFHPTPKQNPMPTGMPPVSHYSDRCLSGTTAAPEYDRFSTGIPAASSTTGSLPVFHSLQSKSDTLPTWKQSRCVTGSCPVLQIPYVTESVPTPKLPTAMTGFRPVQDQYPCAVESHPKRPDVAGLPPVSMPFLSTAEASPVTMPALISIGASPVKKSAITPVDARSATKPTTMSAGSPPVVKTISPSTGASPVGNPATMAVGSRPMVKPTPIPMSTGTSSVGSSALRFTDACSVINYAPVSTSSPPVVKTISPSTGASPVGSSAPTAVGSRPMVKPTPMSAGNSPVGNSVQRSTGASPVVEPILMSTGNDSVGNYALRSTDTRSVFNYAKMPVGSSPMVMPILKSTGAHPMVDFIPMSVGPFPAAKPTLTHIEANPTSQKSTGTSSVVKLTVLPIGVSPEAKRFDDSAGLYPVAKPSPKPTDLRSVNQSNLTSSSSVAVHPPAPTMEFNEINRMTKRTPTTAGTRPARKRVRSRTNQVQIPKTTETRPATRRALMSSGIRPVLEKPPKKLWIVVVLKIDQHPLDPPPVNTTGAYEQLYSEAWPRKPPDGPPKQIRPSEAFVERVSRTRPLNEPTQSILPLSLSHTPSSTPSNCPSNDNVNEHARKDRSSHVQRVADDDDDRTNQQPVRKEFSSISKAVTVVHPSPSHSSVYPFRTLDAATAQQSTFNLRPKQFAINRPKLLDSTPTFRTRNNEI